MGGTDFGSGAIIAEGKTKSIMDAGGGCVRVENKDDITAFDDPSYTRRFASKARCATETTCRVFELLKAVGLPVAYTKQLDETCFLAPRCRMISLEAVARRYAVGSYLKRNPQFEVREGDPPIRFHRLVTEYFLKTTGGKLEVPENGVIISGLDPKKGEEDPFIRWPDLQNWRLYHPKKPVWDPTANMKKEAWAPHVLGEKITIESIDELLRKTFLLIEGAWATMGMRLIDIKLEFGVDENGNLLVADVIDNDNWRLRDANWKELSKESFRQGEALNDVEQKYGVVAELVKQFRIPRQALVVWLPSIKDQFDFPNELPAGIQLVKASGSGHKETFESLCRADQLLRDFPDGGVIIFKLGRSNGAGPVAAAHVHWPVITVHGDWKEKPQNIWSGLDMSSENPHAVNLYDQNAILLALNIFAQKNPAAYMFRQLAIEKLDGGYTA